MNTRFIALAAALGVCTLAAQAQAQVQVQVQVQTSTNAVGPYYATPSWDQKLPSATRFIVLSNWGNQAMLDRETGLVWKLSLESFHFNESGNQADASAACVQTGAGDRAGWRLPTIQELLRTLYLGRTLLPADTPFHFLLGKTLWTSTLNASDRAWSVQVWQQGILTPRTPFLTQPGGSAWCVQSSAGGAVVQ